LKKISPELKVKKYHTLINRIAQSAKVNITPDEAPCPPGNGLDQKRTAPAASPNARGFQMEIMRA
jgi:hypothetical protein